MSNKKHVIIFNDCYESQRRTSGAYRLATLLYERDWDVDVLDFFHKWTEQEMGLWLDKNVKATTKFFGFSFTWIDQSVVKKTIEKLKLKYPHIQILIGGQQPLEMSMKADIYVNGYIEECLDTIIDYMFNGGEKPKGEQSEVSPDTFLIFSNEDYPSMNVKDLSVKYKDKDFVHKDEVLTLELSRGCRFECKYCSYPFLGIKKNTTRDLAILRNELMENYEKWGVSNYILADETINDRDEKLSGFAEVVNSLPFETNYAAFVRIDLVHAKPHHLKLLQDARIWSHFYGIETLNHEAGKRIGKGMHPDKIKETLLKTRESFLDTLGLYRGTVGLIAGLPHETPESWQATEDWFIKNWNTEKHSWWPLGISKKVRDSGLASLIAKNPEKYGYSTMEDEQRIELLYNEYLAKTNTVGLREKGKYLKRGAYTHHRDSSQMLWKAEWADYLDALAFVKTAKEKAQERPPLSSFYILNYYNKFENKADILKLTFQDENYINEETKNFVKQYKKLMIEGA